MTHRCPKCTGAQLSEAEYAQSEVRSAIVGALKDWRGLIGFLCGAVAIFALLLATP